VLEIRRRAWIFGLFGCIFQALSPRDLNQFLKSGIWQKPSGLLNESDVFEKIPPEFHRLAD
jgi:hypothetical protein